MTGYDIQSLTRLDADIRTTARSIGAVYNDELVRKSLETFAEGFSGTGLTLRVTTARPQTLNFRFTGFGGPSHDPLPIAVSAGLCARDGRLTALHDEIERSLPIDIWGADFGTNTGFEKVYACFPVDAPQPFDVLGEIRSMPDAIRTTDWERLGLTIPGVMMALDTRCDTVNLYFHPKIGSLTTAQVERMLTAANLSALPERLLRACTHAFAVYITMSLRTERIERICFPLLAEYPALLTDDPVLAEFVKAVPFPEGQQRLFVHAIAVGADGHYFKMENVYRSFDGEFWATLMQTAHWHGQPHWHGQ